MKDATAEQNPAVAPRLAAAQKALEAAKAAVEQAMRELSVTPRAEKVTIGPRLETAFQQMREAQDALAAIDALTTQRTPGKQP